MKKQTFVALSFPLLFTLQACQKEPEKEVIVQPVVPAAQEVRVITDAPLSEESKALIHKAEKGDISAQKELAERYLSGQGLTINKKEAARWLKASAQSGDPESCIDYAEMLQEGKYIPKNLDEAAYFYQSAADLGLIQGTFLLGKMYYEDYTENEVRKNGLSKIKEIGRQQYLPADLYLGYIYFHDENTPGSKEEAFYWYSKAAEQKNVYGLLALSYMYGNGIGVDSDTNKSDEYYKKFLDLNDLSGILLNEATQIQQNKKIQHHSEIAYALSKYADALSLDVIQKQKIILFHEALAKKMNQDNKTRAEEYFQKLQDPSQAFLVITNVKED